MRTLKIVIAITGLIGIGFVAGFMTQRYVAKARFEKARDFGRGNRMEHYIFRHTNPTEDQIVKLKPIIENYGRQLKEESVTFKRKHKAIRDSLYVEIRQHLTEEQIKALDEAAENKRIRLFQKKKEKMRRKKKRNED